MSGFDAASLAAALALSDGARVVDIGGGTGALAQAILAHCPRCIRRIGGDFFDTPPPPADACVLKDILHDWDDAQCIVIPRRIAESAESSARLYVIERVVIPGRPDRATADIDLTMMVMTGGRERSASQYEALLRQSGWQLREQRTALAGDKPATTASTR